MFSSSQSDGQLACWKCEEMVHQSALYCPYCSADLTKHAPLNPMAHKTQPILLKPSQHPDDTNSAKAFHKSEATKSNSSSIIGFMLSLFFMLAGSSFLFLSIIIATFSKAGSFTLSWQERSWLPYLGLGLAFVSFGMYMLQQRGHDETE